MDPKQTKINSIFNTPAVKKPNPDSNTFSNNSTQNDNGTGSKPASTRQQGEESNQKEIEEKRNKDTEEEKEAIVPEYMIAKDRRLENLFYMCKYFAYWIKCPNE